jgi:riboflavin biosynthesis pyrimidine reductase
MKPLERLFEVPGLPIYEMPPGLAQRYGGVLGFDESRVVANFVSSIDGVVALPSIGAPPSVISRKSEADRFVMSLLRACAGVVLVGAGTLRAEARHLWTPEFVYPQASDDFRVLRRALGLPPKPKLVVLTASGDVDPEIPALRGALVFTTSHGARRLESRRVQAVVGDVVEDDNIDLRRVIGVLRSRGNGMILSEGGPTVTSQLLDLHLLDELFLTISPVLMGRTRSEFRPGLADGVNLLLDGPSAGEVLSVRRHVSHLFVRYGLAPVGAEEELRSVA